MTAPIIDSTSPAYFHEAMTAYERAARDYAEAQRNLIDCNFGIVSAKSDIDEIESLILVNGGHGGVEIDGKNSETRTAQLRVATATHEGWQAATEQLRKLESARAALQADLDEAGNQMAGARRRADYAIAEVHRDAAIKAGLGTERRNGHA